MKKPLPITLEAAASEIDFLLDVATTTRDLQYGSHFVLCGLIRHLDALGIIDARAVITDLLSQAEHIPEKNYQLGVQVVCTDLLTAFPVTPAESGDSVH